MSFFFVSSWVKFFFFLVNSLEKYYSSNVLSVTGLQDMSFGICLSREKVDLENVYSGKRFPQVAVESVQYKMKT